MAIILVMSDLIEWIVNDCMSWDTWSSVYLAFDSVPSMFLLACSSTSEFF